MKRIFGLSTATATHFAFSTALALSPVSAWAESRTASELYEALNGLEIEAQKELQQIRQMKRELNASAHPEEIRVVEESATRQKAKERERQKAEEERRRQEEVARKAAEEKRRAEEQRRQEGAERKAMEQQERLETERKRKERERRLKDQQLEALAEEAQQERAGEERRRREAAAAKARETQMLSISQKYQALIRERLSKAWYPPSSATEEMTARFQISLLPNGELDSVTLASSSGNNSFDNSALGAAVSVSQYPIPEYRDTFERYFRQFTIEFNPRRLR